MSAFWHPLSAVYLDEPRVLASPVVLRMMLAGEKRAVVRYAGDRMWPAVKHGQALQVTPIAETGPAKGDVVVAVDQGILDVLRVERVAGPLELAADAESAPARRVAASDLVGRASVPARGSRARAWRRLGLDLREAWLGRPDSADVAEGVREKYDDQAVHYARVEGGLEPELSRRFAAAVPQPGRVLVAGSGSGREAFGIEALGYDVVGVDFSPRMVEQAQAAATRRRSKVVFHARDLRELDEPEGSLAAIVFTYDMYSFLPTAEVRIAVLRRLRRALAPGGIVFLSARVRSHAADRTLLGLQWIAARARGRRIAWGDSHTRWLDGSGRLRRTFIHVFTPSALDAETRRAGLVLESWSGGHGSYRVENGA